MRLVDSHAHIQADAFASDRAAVIAAAREARIERLLVPGWDAGSSAAALGLAAEWDWIDAAAGVHPHDAALATDSDWALVVQLAADSHVVAIGETGLDFDRMHSRRRRSSPTFGATCASPWRRASRPSSTAAPRPVGATRRTR